ncbi:MAG: hypothetical protein SWH78_17270 [Thermodesulfobacteriota bacterium]|nr:hypothetical protein [Thermodesulfobacteriota bacterium]
MGNLRYYIPGILLIMIAIMIVAFPEILVALVAAAIIMAGIGALVVGHMIRKSGMHFQNMDGGPFDHRPMFRWWHKDS